MTRNLKAFGLALVAMLAIGAIGAQGASAVVEHSFRSDAANTVLTGNTESYSDPNGQSRNLFTITAGLTVECYSTFEGTNAGTVRDTVTVHLNTTCTGGVSLHTGGCNDVFDSDTTQASGHSASSEHASISLECEPSHWIEVTRPGCNITFGDDQVVRQLTRVSMGSGTRP
jgi:hypothetical protein